ncbi:hypothetical protein ABE10_12540 [Bacillus toyonensis]|nr:hypothetical protein [Bacillus toyonensis]
MRDDDDRDALLPVDAGEELQHLMRGLRVERARGLVGEEDRGSGRERPGDPDALLLSPGELLGVGPRLVCEADELEKLGHSRVDVFLGPAGEFERVGDVRLDRLGREEVELLEDHPDSAPDPAQLPLPEQGDVDAVDGDAPRGRRFECVDQPHERRLPGARVADDPVDVAPLDVEGDVVDRDDLGGVTARRRIRLGDAAQADDRHGGAPGSRTDGNRAAHSAPPDSLVLS